MSVFEMVYEIKEEKEIILCSYKFLKNNKTKINKIKMIIENKFLPLNYRYKVINKNLKYLKVKFILFTKDNINLNGMFDNNSSLKEFTIKSEEQSFNHKDNVNKKDIYSSEDGINLCENLDSNIIDTDFYCDKSNEQLEKKKNLKFQIILYHQQKAQNV